MGVFFVKLANAMIKGLGSVLAMITSVLPKSPFPETYDIPFIDGLGWIMPFDLILNTLNAWILCITVYYVYMVVMRWLKLIG